MNTHQEKIISIKAEIDRLTKTDFNKFGDEIRVPKPGKKQEYEAALLRLRQAAEANEMYERAMLLTR